MEPFEMGAKSVKITPDHHRALKMQGVDHGISLQRYLELMLDLVLSEKPVMKHLREEHLRLRSFRR
jgi:hypothetical protein